MSESSPSLEFVQQVKTALGALYDLPALQRHPLTTWLPSVGPAEGVGQRLRRALIEAIEALNPGAGVPFRAPNARPFQLLHLHYVEGLAIQETGKELGLSERQTYRDLRQAELSLAILLWQQRQPQAGLRSVDLSTADREMARWETQLASADPGVLVEQALEAVARLAADQGVVLQWQPPVVSPPIIADAALARQVLVLLLSHAIRNASQARVQIGLEAEGAVVHLHLHYANNGVGEPSPPAAVVQLAARLGWQLSAHTGDIRLAISPQSVPSVLIVDDNEGLIQLLEHYLTERNLRVLVAGDGAGGLQQARQALPAAIILDVMMPGVDGWELLQRLRLDPATAAIPVIVCSFIHDPELARSLGATLFLPKPVRRHDILAALRQVMGH